MAATDVTRESAPRARDNGVVKTARRLSTETKAAFKTTEFYAFIVVLAGVLIAGAVTNGTDGPDHLIARQAWLFAVILTVGYMVSRGLAKSGSDQPYDENGDDRR